MNDSHKVTFTATVIMATLITLITRINSNNGNSNPDNLVNQGNHGNVSNICMILNTSGTCQSTDGRIDMLKIKSTFYKCILFIFSPSQICYKNRELFTTNNETHNYGARQHLDFHYPSANLKKFQTGVHYMSVKINNNLSIYIKNEINNTKKF
jgi:hypothetical protein